MISHCNQIDTSAYLVSPANRFEGLGVRDLSVAEQEAVVELAREVGKAKFKRGITLNNASVAKAFMRGQLGRLNNEVFSIVFLDVRHRLIKYEELFQGTIDGAQVFARVCVHRALIWNAASVILAHNHPSGVAEPSNADKEITNRLKAAFQLVDIRVLDHLIVGNETSEVYSFVESGIL